jgi:hypothetical protein
VHTVGVILLIIGILGFLPSLILWSSWNGPWPWRRERTTTVDHY